MEEMSIFDKEDGLPIPLNPCPFEDASYHATIIKLQGWLVKKWRFNLCQMGGQLENVYHDFLDNYRNNKMLLISDDA